MSGTEEPTPGICQSNLDQERSLFFQREKPLPESKQGNRKERRAQKALDRSKSKLVAKIKKQITSLKKLEQR